MERLLKYLALISALLFFGFYLFISFNRIAYPFELEWMEGGSVDHVSRILEGQPLYSPPSIDFIPYLYTPLYFYVSAAFCKLLDVGLFPLRLVSLLCSLGIFLLLFTFIWRETRSVYWSVIGLCLFAATFEAACSWFDLARTDTLALLLFLGSIYLLRFHTSALFYVLAGLLTAASFFTKQTAVAYALPLFIFVVFAQRRLALYFILSSVLAIVIPTWIANQTTDGWFVHYIFTLQAEQPLLAHRLVSFWTNDLFLNVGIACLVSLVFLLLKFRGRNSERFLFYFFAAVGLIGGTFYSRIHPGNWENVLMPAFAILAIMFALGMWEVMTYLQERSSNSSMMRSALYFLVILQFGMLWYNPNREIPREADLKAGWHFVDVLSRIDGEVFVPSQAYIPTYAGKQSHAITISIQDVLRQQKKGYPVNFQDELIRLAREQRFAAIVLNGDLDNARQDKQLRRFMEEVGKYYEIGERLFDDPRVYWPVTGMRTRPEVVYVPKEVSQP